jgi:Protein of unknown function (DUF3754)
MTRAPAVQVWLALLWMLLPHVIDSIALRFPTFSRVRQASSQRFHSFPHYLRASDYDNDNDNDSSNNDDDETEHELDRRLELLWNGDGNDSVFQKFSRGHANVLVKGNDIVTSTGSNITMYTSSTIVAPKKPMSISCRVVTASDGKIPTQGGLLPESLFQPPHLLAKLDTIYHAMAHEQTRAVKFMEQQSSHHPSSSNYTHVGTQDDDNKVVSLLRQSLTDAGFELLTTRDLDLCQALNAEYLLRLSIVEDLSELDDTLARDFYPEQFTDSHNNDNNNLTLKEDATFLYGGRVLVYWRGYGMEVTRGRLLLPKIDYLQASIVQRAASGIRVRVNIVEEMIAAKSKDIYGWVESSLLSLVATALHAIPSKRVSEWAGSVFKEQSDNAKKRQADREKKRKKEEKMFKLKRYGGYRKSFTSSPIIPSDALTPFTVCEVDFGTTSNSSGSSTNGLAKRSRVNGNNTLETETVEHDIYQLMNRGKLTCMYDDEMTKVVGGDLPPMQLLERVSISNLIESASIGPRRLLKTIFATNQLMEPTYREVIVVWRPLPPEPSKPVIKPLKVVYDVADMFDIQGLPELPKSKDGESSRRPHLEVRAFASVPMANLPAVLPKTKLVFRPADAFVFDLVSIASLILVIGSQRFDNPRLDLLALVSFSLWVFRTVIRYSNKLARYDLLVKKFLTSKITHRNAGAVKYITTEAGSYRATRAALVYTWLKSRTVTSANSNRRDQLVRDGLLGVNELIASDKQYMVDVGAALKDLEDLELIYFSDDGQRLEAVVRHPSSVVAALGQTWASIFEGRPAKTIDTSKDSPRP